MLWVLIRIASIRFSWRIDKNSFDYHQIPTLFILCNVNGSNTGYGGVLAVAQLMWVFGVCQRIYGEIRKIMFIIMQNTHID